MEVTSFVQIFRDSINIYDELLELAAAYVPIDVCTLRLLNKNSKNIMEYAFINKVICRYPSYKEIMNYTSKNPNLCVLALFTTLVKNDYYNCMDYLSILNNGHVMMDMRRVSGKSVIERTYGCRVGISKYCEYIDSSNPTTLCIVGIGDIFNIIRLRRGYKELNSRNKEYVDSCISNYLLSILNEIEDDNDIGSEKKSLEMIVHYYSIVPNISIDLNRNKDNTIAMEKLKGYLEEFIHSKSNENYIKRTLPDEDYVGRPDKYRKFLCGIC